MDDFPVDAPVQRLDNQHPALFGQTPSQTVGPFFHYALPWKGCADLIGSSKMGARPDLFAERHYAMRAAERAGRPAGEAIEVAGRVLDADGHPVPDAMLEIWQTNAAGRYASRSDTREAIPLDPHFVGFARAAVDAQGVYRFRTIRPGRVPGPEGTMQAPHLAMSVFGRGLLKRLATRLYFADMADNASDPLLLAIPPARRVTLVAQEVEGVWWLDVRLAGDRETVFLDL